MKFSRIILSLIALSVISCAREEDKFFNGTASINGVVLFENITTLKSDTAKNAKITLTKTGNTSVKITRALVKGTFNFEELAEGTYTLQASYEFKTKELKNGISYSATQPITFANGEYKADQSIIVASSSYSGTALRLQVKDDKSANLPNAQVCLYTNKEIMEKNANSCRGSMKSGVTNQNGIVLFDELQPRDYYLSAYIGLGKDTLTNKGDATNNTLQLVANSYNPKDISLKLQAVIVKPDPTLLKVNITDSTGAAISNATVCLYSDANTLKKYKLCEGTTESVLSDVAGVATFSNLKANTYYVVAYATIEKKLLSNISTKITDIKVVEANKTNNFNVYLR